jgi:hypothetical protein
MWQVPGNNEEGLQAGSSMPLFYIESVPKANYRSSK